MGRTKKEKEPSIRIGLNVPMVMMTDLTTICVENGTDMDQIILALVDEGIKNWKIAKLSKVNVGAMG